MTEKAPARRTAITTHPVRVLAMRRSSMWILPEGKLELREYAGSIGHNYSVKLNGTMIGTIVDNMDLTVGNIMFDNAFLIVYDAKYLP